MVGKDIRKLTQHKTIKKQRNANKGKTKSHKSRPALKACDPFSGRSYKEKDESEFNLDPDKEELEDYVDNEEDNTTTYSSFKDKPSYRRGIVFADELEDMKKKKKEEKKQKQNADSQNEDTGGRKMGESIREYNRRLAREKRQIIVDEILKNRKPSERVKRYRERNEMKRNERKRQKLEEKEDHKEAIQQSTSTGLKPQVEHPPDLKALVARMEKNNKMFAKEEEKMKSKKIDRKAALAMCKRNMDRFN